MTIVSEITAFVRSTKYYIRFCFCYIYFIIDFLVNRNRHIE